MAEILTLVSLNYPLRTLLLFFPRPLDSVSDSHSSWTENGETFLVGQSLEEEGSKANRIRFTSDEFCWTNWKRNEAVAKGN